MKGGFMVKVGLALSSGGARGFSHIGIIKILEKNNIPIDYIAGTSMGALVGAHYSLYKDVKILEEFALSFKRKDFLKYLDINDPRISLIKGEKAKELLKRTFGDATFKNTKIPVRIGATALEDGSRIILKSGKLWRAVLASGSVPGLLPPVYYKGKHLVDGGLADATPVDIVSGMGADVIIAIDLYKIEKVKLKKNCSSRQVIRRTQDIVMSKLAYYSAQEYGKNIIVIKPKLGDKVDFAAFYKAQEKIKGGELAAKKAMKEIKRKINSD